MVKLIFVIRSPIADRRVWGEDALSYRSVVLTSIVLVVMVLAGSLYYVMHASQQATPTATTPTTPTGSPKPHGDHAYNKKMPTIVYWLLGSFAGIMWSGLEPAVPSMIAEASRDSLDEVGPQRALPRR